MSANGDLKRRHREMWAAGDFPKVSRETVAVMGPALVEAAGIRPGDRVLDVAAGAGNVAIPAAEVGAEVVASDLTPEMFEAGRFEAARRGVELDWVEADAESLPLPDDGFDVVLSSMGVMFAPDQPRAAAELVRVCRPGGTIALMSGRPGGKFGELMLTIVKHSPPPPEGFVPPIAWGVPDHLRGLFGERVEWSRFEPQVHTIDIFRSPQDFVDYYRNNFGPVIVAFDGLRGDAEATASFEADLLALAASMAGPDGVSFPFEYLLAVGSVRSPA